MKIKSIFRSFFVKNEPSDLETSKLTLRRDSIVVCASIFSLILVLAFYLFKTPKMQSSPYQKEVEFRYQSQGISSQIRSEEIGQHSKEKDVIKSQRVSKPSHISVSNQITINRGSTKKDMLTTGTLIEAILLNKIVSNSLELPALAIIPRDIRSPVTKNIVIPKGSKIIGRALFDAKGKRLQIYFQRIISPNQKSQSISALAMDKNEGARAGLSGTYYSEKWKKISGILLSSFLGGTAQALKEDHYSPFGIPIEDKSLKGVALEGLATAAFTEAQRQTEALNSAEGYVEISQGTPFLLFFIEDF